MLVLVPETTRVRSEVDWTLTAFCGLLAAEKVKDDWTRQPDMAAMTDCAKISTLYSPLRPSL